MSTLGGCAGPGASTGKAAAGKKTFDREIKIHGDARIVRHSWRKHTRGWYLTSTLLWRGGTTSGVKEGSVVPGSDEALLERASCHAEAIKTRAEKCRTNVFSPAAAVRNKRKTADTVLSKPMAVALAGGTRGNAAARTQARQESVSVCSLVLRVGLVGSRGCTILLPPLAAA